MTRPPHAVVFHVCTCVLLLSTQINQAEQYDPNHPSVVVLTEEAREAYWKLTARKGFAALKVNMHQQQQQQHQQQA